MPELHCETCRQEMLFEVPPCVDGHGADCPELVCTGCGAALLITSLATLAEPLPARRGVPARDVPASRRCDDDRTMIGVGTA